MKFIKENKTRLIVIAVCLILILLIFIAIYSMFNPNNKKSVYGSRLDGEVNITDSEYDKVKQAITLSGIVNSVTINKNVRIIKAIINVKDDTKVESAEALSDIILNNFSKEILSYYDVEVYITSNSEDYPIIGYHSKSADAFTWTVNRGEVSE